MKSGLIYKIKCLSNEKLYVGFTAYGTEHRLKEHFYDADHGSERLLAKAIRKYGKENFVIEPICSLICEKNEIAKMEDHFIDTLCTLMPSGYNMVHSDYTEERREFISDFMKKEWKKNPERQKVAENLSRIAKTPENIKLRNSAYQEYIKTPEGKQKVHEIAKYKWESGSLNKEDHMKRLTTRWAIPGEREKMGVIGKEANLDRQTPIVSVCVYTGAIKHYDCVHDARRDGFSVSSIYACLNKTAKKGQEFCWFYKDDSIDYVAEAVKLLGAFKPEFRTPIEATNESGFTKRYENVHDMKKDGFLPKQVLRAIRERDGNHKGCKIRFI